MADNFRRRQTTAVATARREIAQRSYEALLAVDVDGATRTWFCHP